MINRPNDWDSVSAYTQQRKAPEAGAYICRVKQTNIVKVSNGSEQLVILFDIQEGEFAGFYDNDYKTNTRYGQKWRGVIKYWLPKDNDTSDLNQSTKSKLKGMITAFENSNQGYRWNWDERSLNGKLFGILYRNEEWENDEGKRGWKAQPFIIISTSSVRENDYTLPKDKPLEKTSEANDSYAYSPQTPVFEDFGSGDGNLPF